MTEPSTVACNEAGPRTSATHVDELFQALQRLDQLLERAMLPAQVAYGTAPGADPYRGLYISEQEVERLLAREPGAPVLRAELAEAEVPSLAPLSDVSRPAWLAQGSRRITAGIKR